VIIYDEVIKRSLHMAWTLVISQLAPNERNMMRGFWGGVSINVEVVDCRKHIEI
jgi:hypothetical protein